MTQQAPQHGERPPSSVFGPPGWGPWHVFVAAGATYSAYRILQLLLAKAITPLDPPSTTVRIGLGLLDGALVDHI
jgi:hypothetical protein